MGLTRTTRRNGNFQKTILFDLNLSLTNQFNPVMPHLLSINEPGEAPLLQMEKSSTIWLYPRTRKPIPQKWNVD
jgi:hypothetical protein